MNNPDSYTTRTFDENELELFPQLCFDLAQEHVEFATAVLGLTGAQITYHVRYEKTVRRIAADIFGEDE